MASVQPLSPSQDTTVTATPPEEPAQATTTEEAGDAPPSPSKSFEQSSKETISTSPNKSSCPTKGVIVYSRRHILNLSASPLVQRPEGMPALKDWFGCVAIIFIQHVFILMFRICSDWAEQHAYGQGKKDGPEANGTTGNRRFVLQSGTRFI